MNSDCVIGERATTVADSHCRFMTCEDPEIKKGGRRLQKYGCVAAIYTANKASTPVAGKKIEEIVKNMLVITTLTIAAEKREVICARCCVGCPIAT